MRCMAREQGSAILEDRGSFDGEVAACRFRLLGYARHLTHQGAEAEDLVQETILRAFKSWRSFEPGTRLEAWLRTILFHLFVNQYRQGKRVEGWHSLDEESGPISMVVCPSFGTERVAGRRALGESLTHAINQLGPDQRDAVRLSDVEGFSDDEVSALLDIPIGTVKSRLFRARRRLRDALREPAADLGYGLAVQHGGGLGYDGKNQRPAGVPVPSL
ncbi:MAG: RNA polymerase sigma factor [Gemmatimonadota bacterium]|nr:RNA polymerase sigma factor [Gemmatimonadota bacterium]